MRTELRMTAEAFAAYRAIKARRDARRKVKRAGAHAPAALTEPAVGVLIREQGEVNHRFAEAIQTVRSVAVALEHGDRAEASRLLTEAADIELDLTGDTVATSDLFEALGLEDGAARRSKGGAR